MGEVRGNITPLTPTLSPEYGGEVEKPRKIGRTQRQRRPVNPPSRFW
jgi:hypothetical protein